jgi:3-polyprenyl-4-hydroxybenzoate decarboxylase
MQNAMSKLPLPSSLPIVLAITGASGAVYAVRLLHQLLQAECRVQLVVSPSGAAVIKQELDIAVDPARLDVTKLVPAEFAARANGVICQHRETRSAPLLTPAERISFTGRPTYI